MTSDNKCQRCNAIENSKHMLWDCYESKKIWALLNNILQESNLESEILTEYSDIYKITNNCAMTHIKMKIIQEMIQIHRPTGWTKETVIDAINTIINMEKYIAKKNNTIIRWMKKWINFKNIAT
jgi:predicted nucleic-acid-binding protein